MNQAQATDWMTHRPVASGVSLMHLFVQAPQKKLSLEKYHEVTLKVIDSLTQCAKSAQQIAAEMDIPVKMVRDRLNKLARRGHVEKTDERKPYEFRLTSLACVRQGGGGVSSGAGEGDAEDAQGGDSGSHDFVHRRQSYDEFKQGIAGQNTAFAKRELSCL